MGDGILKGGPAEVECYLRNAKPCVDRKKQKKTSLNSVDELPPAPCKQMVYSVIIVVVMITTVA